MKHEYVIEGMHCDGCVRRVKAVLGKIGGVVVDEVTVGRAVVDIADPEKTGAIFLALQAAGYEASEAP